MPLWRHHIKDLVIGSPLELDRFIDVAVQALSNGRQPLIPMQLC